MGLFLRQDVARSEMQSKIAADLKERLKDRALVPEVEHEPAILDGQHETRPAGLLISILLLVLLGFVIWLLLAMAGIV